MNDRQAGGHLNHHGQGHNVRIRRTHSVADAMDGLPNDSVSLKHRVQITFVDEHGNQEDGIDGGGLFKEFIDVVSKQAFSPDYGMFKITCDQALLYPNPASDLVSTSHIDMFEFMGRLLGKALYESTLVEPVFASFFLNKLLDRPNYVDDLRSLDYDLHKNLLSITQLEDVSILDLTFSVLEDRLGAQSEIALIIDGENVMVNNSNRHRYIASMAYYYLHQRIRTQSNAFRRGLNKCIPVGWIRMFNSKELQLIIGGSSSKFDINDMKRHSNCSNGYHPDQPYIQSFWKILSEFSIEQQAKFMKFVTSCSRPPLLGFKKLNPKFCLQQIRIDHDSDRLPIAATCFNLLKLPKYSSSEVLKAKLLLAINEAQGFTLS